MARRTNVRKQRRAAQVRQGRGRRDGRRPLLSTCRASMQHFTVPVSSFDQSVFDDGLAFDGSSIRGFQAINESDMALFPDPTTAYVDPFRTVEDAQPELLHPRPDHRRGLLAATRATSRARRWPTSTPPASRTPRTSPPRRSSTSSTRSATRPPPTRATTTSTRSRAGGTRARRATTCGYKTRFKGGYFPVAPYDHYGDLRDDDGQEPRGRAACWSSAPTTRSAPPARRRSTTGSTRCSRPPTT